jgi:cell division septation protein DedD
MKQADSKDKSSVVFIGKGVIILSIIITASLSFALGFFVGKSIRPKPDIQTSVLSPQNIEPVTKEDPVQPPAPAQEMVQTPAPAAGETPKSPEIHQVKETARPMASDETKKQIPDVKPSVSKEAQKEVLHNGSQSKRYTVQVDAFKRASSANSLKEKLNKKGYKSSVTTVKTKKHEKLYKVIVGDLETKKEADALSSRLRKSENLQHAFVVPKNDQEVLR